MLHVDTIYTSSSLNPKPRLACPSCESLDVTTPLTSRDPEKSAAKVADARSVEAQKAAEKLLPEEDRPVRGTLVALFRV